MTAAVETFGCFIGGEWVRGTHSIDVKNPQSGQQVAAIAAGSPDDVRAAIDAADASLATPFPLHERCDVLMRAASRIDAQRVEYADAIAREGSKTIREARREPPRAANILRLAAEEGRRLAGETLPFDSRAGSENRVGYFFRFPVGVVAAITPFNDPLAMFAHKVGPALAAGNAVVLKPSSATPLSALRAAGDLAAAGLPPGRLNVVTGSGELLGPPMVADARVRLVTFTGGVSTGEQITRIAGLKKLSMELGSNSPVIVLADARIDRAVDAIVAGGFGQAGQNCLSVQRVFIHKSIYNVFKQQFVEAVSRLRVGLSTDETTDVCGMIDLKQAVRVAAWIDEAVRAGARVLVGGRRDETLVYPTVLEDVPAHVHVNCDEVYGPVVSLYEVESLDEAIEQSNATAYGLHAAVFTESLRDAFAVVQRLSVGAVIVNDSTDYRLDTMPFGGTKSSGIGREGIRAAIETMTETRVVCLNL